MSYVIIALSITFIVLITGLILMITGGKLNKKFASKLMFLRIIFQALAIVALAAIYFLSKHTSHY